MWLKQTDLIPDKGPMSEAQRPEKSWVPCANGLAVIVKNQLAPRSDSVFDAAPAVRRIQRSNKRCNDPNGAAAARCKEFRRCVRAVQDY